MQRPFRTYDAFWPWYLTMHARPVTRFFHHVGTLFAGFCALVLLPYTTNAWWPIIGIAGAYIINWPSHALFERNGPATWKHPYWSILADLEMFLLSVAGRLDLEFQRVPTGEAASTTRARRLLRGLIWCLSWGYGVALVLAFYRDDIQFYSLL